MIAPACPFCGAARPLADGSCSNCGYGSPPAQAAPQAPRRPALWHWTRQRILADPAGFQAQQARDRDATSR